MWSKYQSVPTVSKPGHQEGTFGYVCMCVSISVLMTKHYYHLKDEVKNQHVIGRYPANLNQHAVIKRSGEQRRLVDNKLLIGKQHQVGPPPPPKKRGGGCIVNKDGSKNGNAFLSLQSQNCQKGERTEHLELKWGLSTLYTAGFLRSKHKLTGNDNRLKTLSCIRLSLYYLHFFQPL